PEGARRRDERPAPMGASCCMCGTRKHSSVPDLQAPTTRPTSSLGSDPIVPGRRAATELSSAGAVDATGEVEVLLGGAGQDADEHDPAGVDGYDLGHGRVRLLIADDHIVTDTEHDSGLDVADVGVRETVAVGAVIIDPKIPR